MELLILLGQELVSLILEWLVQFVLVKVTVGGTIETAFVLLAWLSSLFEWAESLAC